MAQQEFYTILTAAGLAYEANRKAGGLPIKLTQMSVGDGNGAVYNPDATQTALRREVWRGPINALLQDATNPSYLVGELSLPDDVGGWYVREVGFWTDTGILYAIGKYPESFKPKLASGAGKEFYIRAIFETSNADSVTLVVDDTVVKATRAFVIDYVANRLAASAPLMDGAAAVGVSIKHAREDHRHPTDTTRAPLASPALTGTPTAPTAPAGTNTTQIATTAFVASAKAALDAVDALKAPLASPALTGTPTAPTAPAGTNTTQIATTAFVASVKATLDAVDALKAPLHSPKFTGTAETVGTMFVATAGGGLELGRSDGTAGPAYIDFHSGGGSTDYDARIISTGGNGSLAGATLTIQCGSLGLPENTRLPNPSAETMDDRVATTAFVHKVVGAGAVQLFARSTPPPGWLPANGALVSRTTYAALFAAIGTTFGAGDGSTTFNLPDLRGEFLRGWDAGRGIDPGRSLGSSQESALQAHTHSVPEGSSNSGTTGYFSGYTSGDDYANTVAGYSTSGSTGGNETRPRNIALLACIKY